MKLKMGELSKMSGIAITTIMYYEKSGLLEPSWRTSGRFRLYDDYLLDRLRFIRICRQQGLTYKEIKKLLKFRDRPEEGEGLSVSWIDELIKKTENEIYLLGRHIKELKALRSGSLCARRIACEILKDTDPASACLYCKDFTE